jgi:hypothetical protein
MTVRFIYESDDKNIDREAMATKIVDYLSSIVNLPADIEIVFAILDQHVYGNTPVNPRFKNRVNINNIVTTKELPQVLLHELLHLSQIKSGKLSNTSNGHYLWEGIRYDAPRNADYNYYQNLPWEVDVAYRQRQILPGLLTYLSS